MKAIIKHSEIIKRSLVVAIASILAIVSIITFALSYEVYDDGWGTDISFDMDSVVLFLCSIAILVYGIYSIVAYRKNLSTKNAYYASFGVVSVLIAFYPLGTFFKAMAKEKPFLENQEYLYIGIIGIVMILYLAASYISDTKKN